MLSYSEKAILAPMVRYGTLPFRLLALRYGADIVYGEEIIDFKMVSCTRKENRVLGTIDFSAPDGSCVFRTCAEEKEQVVFQMGTASPDRALQVAKLVENDVAGIDVNMGCPKPFSISGGMGAALLTKPDQVHAILSTLVNGLRIPVTCKMRLLPTVEETISLVKVIESTGVAAITLHGRYKNQRPSVDCHVDIMRQVIGSTSLPIIANGGSRQISCYEDIAKFREATGAASVMVARSAMYNPSLFRKEGNFPWNIVALDYFKLGVHYQPVFANTKYAIAAGLAVSILKTPQGQELLASRTFEELANSMGWRKEFDEIEEKLCAKEAELQISRFGLPLVVGDPCPKFSRLSYQPDVAEDGTMEMHIMFQATKYGSKPPPKVVLLEWARRNGKGKPEYTTTERSSDRAYKAVLTLGGQKYSSSFWERSKRAAEHAASLVCIEVLQIADPRWSDA